MILSGDVLTAKPKSSKENSEPFLEPLEQSPILEKLVTLITRDRNSRSTFIHQF
jgi:hypothetical protein